MIHHRIAWVAGLLRGVLISSFIIAVSTAKASQ